LHVTAKLGVRLPSPQHLNYFVLTATHSPPMGVYSKTVKSIG
jgi:hypothetical protein